MPDTAKRLARGAGWLYAYRWGERLLDLISIVVLARLLTAEDFGIVAIAASVVAIIEGLSNFDVDKALIHHRDAHRSLYDTGWTLSSLRGILTALVMAVIALWLTEERIAPVLLALSISPLLKGISNPRFVIFERDLVYSRLAWLSLGSKVVTFTVTLVLAVLYQSYWALVWGTLGGALTNAVLTYALKPYRPRVSLQRTREIFAFSGWMSLTSVITTLSMETDKIIVGRLLGVADAGRYFMTQRVGVLPTRELISPLQRILFPSFSEIAEDRRRLRRVVVESINVLGGLSLPAGFGFALVANDLVPLALGAEWNPIVPLLIILVPFLGLRGTLSMTLPCVMAMGRTRMLFKVSTVYALVHIPAFVTGTVFYGLIGAIGSIVAAGMFYTYLNMWMLRQTLDVTVAEILGALMRPLTAAATMVTAVVALAAATDIELLTPGGDWQALAAKITLGCVVYFATLVGLWIWQGRPPGIEQRGLQLWSTLRAVLARKLNR